MTTIEERILVPETTDQFLWIVVVGVIGAFFAAYGIGANDVANAFATSVGAKAITLRQAVIFAGIFEFLGALLLGSHVTETIRSGIADVECFRTNPGILMYGMMCVVYTTGLWLLLASYLELPVSTTHSTVGGIVGMAMAYGGAECVTWYEEQDTFPFVDGIAGIVTSWILSPFFSGILALAIFLAVRTFVLRSEHAHQRSFWVYPVLVLATISVNVFFITYKGAKGLDLDDTKLSTAFAWAFGLGGGLALLTICTVIPYMKKKVASKFNEDGTAKARDPVPEVKEDGATSLRAYINRTLDQDLHAAVKDSEYVSQIHGNAEKFDPRAEEVFKYIQVLTAICDSFGHGANDVANAMGPFAAIYTTYTDGAVLDGSELGGNGFWILAIGGVGIVVGLMTYGYKIITAIGVKIAKITPSRGFSIELGAAIMIIIGSRLSMPLSTTHCQVGATAAVALLEGSGGLNNVVILKTVVGWVITLIICGLTCALLFAQGAYAPYAYDTIDIDE